MLFRSREPRRYTTDATSTIDPVGVVVPRTAEAGSSPCSSRRMRAFPIPVAGRCTSHAGIPWARRWSSTAASPQPPGLRWIRRADAWSWSPARARSPQREVAQARAEFPVTCLPRRSHAGGMGNNYLRLALDGLRLHGPSRRGHRACLADGTGAVRAGRGLDASVHPRALREGGGARMRKRTRNEARSPSARRVAATTTTCPGARRVRTTPSSCGSEGTHARFERSPGPGRDPSTSPGLGALPRFLRANDAAQHIRSTAPARSALRPPEDQLRARSRPFAPTINSYVRVPSRSILLVEFAGEDRDEQVRCVSAWRADGRPRLPRRGVELLEAGSISSCGRSAMRCTTSRCR